MSDPLPKRGASASASADELFPSASSAPPCPPVKGRGGHVASDPPTKLGTTADRGRADRSRSDAEHNARRSAARRRAVEERDPKSRGRPFTGYESDWFKLSSEQRNLVVKGLVPQIVVAKSNRDAAEPETPTMAYYSDLYDRLCVVLDIMTRRRLSDIDGD